MDKNKIKKYAVWARRELIERVSQRAMLYGITKQDAGDPNADSVNGRLLSPQEKRQRQALIHNVRARGFEQVMEEAAYTWFNRFAALRFMEVNGYLPSHIRVFTNDAGAFKPQILAEAIHLELDGLDRNRVYELEQANKSEELYKYLLIVQCNALNSILPGMFQKIDDYTELLFPDNLLREGSVIEQMVTAIPEEDWTDQVQIIGWLYQYYNTEPKDQVFANLKKNIKITKENIPAATQLFTPDWIVRYMVENSLGRLWVEHLRANDDTGYLNLGVRDVSVHQEKNGALRFDSIGDYSIKKNWKYYLDEARQEPEVQARLAEIRREYAALRPEDIRVIDPCCGSGHILCVLFDVLVQIYQDYGYSAREAAALIVEQNLWGLDIDPRAAQLANFSVMMKALRYDRRFFRRRPIPQPHVYSPGDWEEGREFGSLIQVDELEPAPDAQTDLFGDNSMDRWRFRRTLAQKYHVVVTNPPYMGASGMNGRLSDFVKQQYPDSKSDLSTAFMEKSLALCCDNGYMSMINIPVWMFIASYSKLRKTILTNDNIVNMLHLGRGVFGSDFGTTAFVLQKCILRKYNSLYQKLYLVHGAVDSIEQKEKWFFERIGICNQEQAKYLKIPGMPIAYWVSDSFIDSFSSGKLIGEIGQVSEGIKTGDNDRFLRFWYEINKFKFSFANYANHTKWIPYHKGGDYRKWYGNNTYAINWENDGAEIKKQGNSGLQGKSMYFKSVLGYSKISAKGNPLRYFDEGILFDSMAPSIDVGDYQYYVLGLLNSVVGVNYIRVLNPTMATQVGDIKNIPVILCHKIEVEGIVKTCIAFSREDWDSFETSWDFQRHPLIRPVSTLSAAFDAWAQECETRFQTLKANEEALNRIFIHLYGLQDELTPDVADKDVTVRRADLGRDIRSLISYAVGCMFGRYSLLIPGLVFAGGEWPSIEKAIGIREKYYPNLDPGICSWMDAYGDFTPDIDGIIPITDDEYFKDDMVGRFIQFIETVYGKETLEENLRFIADALGGKGSPRAVIRSYFLNDFYADHLKVYQKRPIYWLFDSGKKNGFKCLIYMHRYQPDTIARIRTDYVHEQQGRYRTAISDLEQRMNGVSTSERVKLSKQLARVKAQAEELRVYEEKIHHLADQMIRIDLDDGVKHNYAIFKDVLAKIK